MLDIKDLEAFIAILNSGSISSAAASLGLTQPALSLKLKKIETELGVQLFQRTPRKVLPLETARVIEAKVRDILSRVESIHEALATSINELSGQVRVGCLMGWFDTLMTPLAQELSQSARGLRLKLHTDQTTENLLFLLVHGRLDIAVIAQPFEAMEGIATQHLLDEELVLIGRDLPVTKDLKALRRELLARPWVTLDVPDALVDKYWHERFGESFPWDALQVPVCLDHILAVASMVRNIEGAVAVVPRQIMTESNSNGLFIADTVPQRNGLFLAWRREGFELQRYHIVKTLIAEMVKKYAESRNQPH